MTPRADSMTVAAAGTVRIDSGSARQVRGAMNVPWASTRASVVYAIRAMTDPSRPTNDGILRAVEIICPKAPLAALALNQRIVELF